MEDPTDERATTESGAVYFNPEQMRHDAEEYEACMSAMDDAGVPREIFAGAESLSLWGRACWMARNGNPIKP